MGNKETTYFKCDICQGYHPESEKEVVVIKLIKSKSCLILNNTIFNNEPKLIENELKTEKSGDLFAHKESKIEEQKNVYDPADPHFVKLLNADELAAERKKKVIPPQFAAMMIPSTDPQFETKGAKIIRRIP